MVWSAIVTVRDAEAKGWYGYSTPSARGEAAVMEAITVTMLIYLFVLAPALFTQPGAYQPFTLTDNLVHIVTPVLVIVDWLLFIPKGEIKPYDPLLWALIPYSYLAFAFIYSAAGVSTATPCRTRSWMPRCTASAESSPGSWGSPWRSSASATGTTDSTGCSPAWGVGGRPRRVARRSRRAVTSPRACRGRRPTAGRARGKRSP